MADTNKIALALSGGGFRATLFHLGVVRLLRDAGRLRDVTHICSVSGGSILAAHLMLNWDRYTSTDDAEFDEAARELVDFTKYDVRGRILRRWTLLGPFWFLLRKMTFNCLPRLTLTVLLQRYYDKKLFHNKTNDDLPGIPHLHILAANLTNGGACSVTKHGLSVDFRPGQDDAAPVTEHQTGQIPIAFAVASSSAFPAMFPPTRLDEHNVHVRDLQPPLQLLTDGGVFDNLGIRKFRQILRVVKLNAVLVSDAGKVFRREHDLGLTDLIVGTAIRASDILGDRLNQTEKELAANDDRFMFITINDTINTEQPDGDASDYVDRSAPHPDIQDWLPFARTDFDRFPDEVASSLVRHGYCVARKALNHRFDQNIPLDEPWDPTRVEHSTSTDARNFKAIRKAARRRLGIVSFRDPIVYLQLPVLAVLCFFAGRYLPGTIHSLENDVARLVRLPALHFPNVVPLPTRWDPRADLKVIEDMDDPDYEGFEILKDEKVWDLRCRKQVNDPFRKETERISPVFQTRHLRLRRKKEAKNNDRIRIQYKTSGVAVDPRCAAFPFEVRRGSDPDQVLGEKNLKRFEILIDVSDMEEGKLFDLEIEAIFWNAFQGKEKEWAATQVDADLERTSIWVIFPPDKPFEDFDVFKGPRSCDAQATTAADVVAGRTKHTLWWDIHSPDRGYYYKLEWKW